MDSGQVEVGCHLTITSGKPVSEKMKGCATFVHGGHFRDYLFLKRDGTVDKENRDEIKSILKEELRAQVNALHQQGLIVRHLSHHHNALCSFPEYMEALFEVADELSAGKPEEEIVRVRSAHLLPEEKNLLLPVVLGVTSQFSMGVPHVAERTDFMWTLNKWAEQYKSEHNHLPRTPVYIDAFHYGPLGFVSPGESTWQRKAVVKSETLIGRYAKYQKEDIPVEIVFHLIDPALGESWRSMQAQYEAEYPGVATNYFDSRQIEYESLKITFTSGTKPIALNRGEWLKV
jgi:predicted glycoside hydrolase/deacetylase ChbG (UPF0249 family)